MRRFTAREIQQYLEDTDTRPLLLDVREPWEFQVCRLPDSQLVPMRQIPMAVDGLAVIDYTDSEVSSAVGIHNYNALCYVAGWNALGAINGSSSVATATAGTFLFDDVALGVGAGATDYIGAGHSLCLTGNGQGTYTGWGSTATTVEYVQNDTNQAAYIGGVATDGLTRTTTVDQCFIADLPRALLQPWQAEVEERW